MTKEQLMRLDALLETVEKPARYTAGEMNSEIKAYQPGMARYAFCFADTYEVGMSHLGMKILLDQLNRQPDMVAERAFMPWVDMLQGLKDEALPLFSLETRTALNRFDVLGFTLQYEMAYTNILAMLEHGGVALLSKDRGEDAPFVSGGGPCAFNPEPLADFFDFFVIGDGENAIVDTTRLIMQGRQKKLSRQDILISLTNVSGVYVPSLYEAQYHEDGTLKAFDRLGDRAPLPVKKSLEMDLDALPYPEAIPVPFTEVVHDRVVLEIMRGCQRGCRFCQAGMLYRPIRERSVSRLTALADKLIAATGYEEVSLSSLSCGDYQHLEPLVSQLMDKLSPQRIGLSLPSLRLDSPVKKTLEDMAKVRKTGLTLAPEAGTQRLRDVINKGVTEDDLLRAVTDAFETGYASVKFYFMMGLPTETDEDLLGIADLVRKTQQAFRETPREKRAPSLNITVSCAVFVPKPFTPFQWAPQDSLAEIERKTALLRTALKMKGVRFNWHDGALSRMEAALARGDRRLSAVILRAYRAGAILDGWSEYFKMPLWEQAFTDEGLDIDFYVCRDRAKDELLPWDFIDIGVTKRFLWLENERALKAQVTPYCMEQCQGCGLMEVCGK